MNKLTIEYQSKFKDHLIYDIKVFEGIDSQVKLHEETKKHPLSSAAACLNVIGSMSLLDPDSLRSFLNKFGLEIEEIVEFPGHINVGGREYQDTGYVVFEWVGPKKSPINETGGGRGQNRTSIDAFLIVKIRGRLTQLIVEWKFTEGISREIALGRFCGGEGLERLHRYSAILAGLRRKDKLPFRFIEKYKDKDPNSHLGLYDLSPDHFYQLLRMTLLAEKTTPMDIGPHQIEDYRILHLTHSQNDRINVVHPEYLVFSPGLQQYAGQSFHKVWQNILTNSARERFFGGYWDKALPVISDERLRNYLMERYG